MVSLHGPVTADNLLISIDMDDFIAPDDSEDEVVSHKRKRQQPSKTSTKPAMPSSPPAAIAADDSDGDVEMVLTAASSAQQWTYDPDNLDPLKPRIATQVPKSGVKIGKVRPSDTVPEKRHIWLTDVLDADR